MWVGSWPPTSEVQTLGCLATFKVDRATEPRFVPILETGSV
jgi:hypothetical protein